MIFGTLIDVDTEGNIFVHDKGIALLPKMWEVYKKKGMGSNMVKWIVMVEDYKSPYRKLPIEERIAFTTGIIFEKKKYKTCEDPLVEAARKEYVSIQYDPLIDQYNAYSDQIFEMTRVYKSIKPNKENLQELNKISVELAKTSKSRDDVKALIIKDQESEIKIQGAGSENFSMFEEEKRLTGG